MSGLSLNRWLAGFLAALLGIATAAQPIATMLVLSGATLLAAIVAKCPSFRLVRIVQDYVLRLLHKLKILGTVIRLIAVLVVNNFMSLQSSSKHLLHDNAVLKPMALARSVNNNISSGGFQTTAFPPRLMRATHARAKSAAAGSYLIFSRQERLFAVFADTRDFFLVVVHCSSFSCVTALYHTL